MMTNEQAKTFLLQLNTEKIFNKSEHEAIRVAIKALEQQPSEDCVSRAEVLKQMKEWRDCEFVKMTNPYHYLEKRIQSMPLVTPTHRMCKDCTKSKILNGFEGYSIVCSRFGRMAVNPDFYCADFEKGGSENGSN